MRFSFRLDSSRDYHYGTHPEEVNRLRREDNPATIKKYPILSFNDFVRSYVPKGVPNGEFAKYLKRALGHWKWKQFDTPNKGIADNLNSTFEAVKGAVFLNEEIVVLLQRTVGKARLSMARFRPDRSYVSNSFSVLGIPSEADPRGMTLAGNQVFVLDAARILALDRGFAYVASENVAVTSLDPVSVGWNGNALLVYDDGSVDFYGGQQQGLPTTPVKLPRQYRSRAFRKYEEMLDVVKRNADGTLVKRGIGVKGLRYSTIEEVYVADSTDLTTFINLHTIIPQYPMPEIEVDDFIFGNMGATDDNPPMELPAERYQVKGFGEWGGYKQVLYCVRVRGDGEADALAGAHSPLRVRNRR